MIRFKVLNVQIHLNKMHVWVNAGSIIIELKLFWLNIMSNTNTTIYPEYEQKVGIPYVALIPTCAFKSSEEKIVK